MLAFFHTWLAIDAFFSILEKIFSFESWKPLFSISVSCSWRYWRSKKISKALSWDSKSLKLACFPQLISLESRLNEEIALVHGPLVQVFTNRVFNLQFWCSCFVILAYCMVKVLVEFWRTKGERRYRSRIEARSDSFVHKGLTIRDGGFISCLKRVNSYASRCLGWLHKAWWVCHKAFPICSCRFLVLTKASKWRLAACACLIA